MHNLCRVARIAISLPLQNWSGRFITKCVEDAPDWETLAVVAALELQREVELTQDVGSVKKGTRLSRVLYWLIQRCSKQGLLQNEEQWKVLCAAAIANPPAASEGGQQEEPEDTSTSFALPSGPRPNRKELTGVISTLGREIAGLKNFGFEFREFVFSQIDSAMVAGGFTPDGEKWSVFMEELGKESYAVISVLAAFTRDDGNVGIPLREWLIGNSREIQRQLNSVAVLKLIWQPRCPALVRYLESEEAKSDEEPPPIPGKLDPSKFLLRAIEVAASSTRARHRHGAVLFLDPDLLRERLSQLSPEGVPKDIEKAIEALDWEDRIVATGCNTELLTTGWKASASGASNAKDASKTRWKVIHAEIVALCEAASDDDVKALLFPEVTTEDAVNLGGGCVGSPRFRALLSLLKGVKCGKIKRLAGCLRIAIAELHDNTVQFCASQACPLCIKGLKRWALESHTYTTGTPELFKTEPIRWDPELVCESLQGAIAQFAAADVTASGGPPTKARRMTAPAALPNVLL